jgi:uncharacterized protein YraI
MMYVVETLPDGTLFSPSLMMIRTGVEAIIRFCLSNLDGCNVGITDGSGI